MSSTMLNIEVVYALPHSQTLLQIVVPVGTTVSEAVAQSGIVSEYPEIDIASAKMGIWNKVVKPNTELKEADRIEIYRPLIADPKEIRKRRAEKAKEDGRADKVTGGRPNRVQGS